MKTSPLKQCRICKDKDIIKRFNFKGKFSIYYCKNCETDLLFPIPSMRDIEQSTDKEYFRTYEDESIKVFKTNDFKRILKEISHSKIRSALDVGCANAYLVEYLLKERIDAYGIELFPEVALEAQKKFKQKRIYMGEFTSYKFRRKFDLIIMFDFIEHITDPSAAFKKARALLNRDGFVLILTPDISAFKKKLLGRLWTAYYIEHINCYSPTSINYLANKSNLKVYKIRRFYKRVNLHYFIRHLFHRFDFFKFLHPLTRFHFINFTFPINDDSMLVILKKNV